MKRRRFLAGSAISALGGFALQRARGETERWPLGHPRSAGTRVLPAGCTVGGPGPAPGQVTAPFLEGDDPLLPAMPERPTLVDFFERRFSARDLSMSAPANHLLQSATAARRAGLPQKTVLACLLHDVGMTLMRTDHGYWGAAMIEPYVDAEVSWAVRNHQALRFFPDEAMGYPYPKSYVRYFGADYQPEPYLVEAANQARRHRWYPTARQICVNDVYAFDPNAEPDFDSFVELIGRHFRTPKEGLGFDESPAAHMWRTLIWPNNFL